MSGNGAGGSGGSGVNRVGRGNAGNAGGIKGGPTVGSSRASFDNLTALTEQEIDQYDDEEPRAGENRAGGVGLVRVAGSKDVDWVFVRCFELEERTCFNHLQVPMAIFKTKSKTMYNLEEAIYYRCKEPLGEYTECQFNQYVVFDRAEFERQMLANSDLVIIQWTSKKQNQ